MKTLTKLLLTNWHYFSHEVINFDQINFLTGVNGSGKTTIIDAIQLVMLGDTNGHYFNKSASEKSSRSLRGYLRCEIGDNDDGSTLYLRSGRFTSYIAVEFYDEVKDNSFTMGIVFDNFEDGSHDYRYFYYNGQIPENEFIEDKIPLTQKQLNIYLVNRFEDVKFFPSNIEYREFLKAKLGNLSNNFFSLFKKAIPFTPINNIETFIKEYVCDVENTIDVKTMQENFRNYKKLEIETNNLVKRVNVLKDICDKYNDYQSINNDILVKKYIMDRSDLYLASHDQEKINLKVNDLNADIEEYQLMISSLEEKEKELNEKKTKLIEEKSQSDVYKRRQIYEVRLDNLQKEIDSLEATLKSIKTNLSNYINNWTNAINEAFIDLGKEFKENENGKLASTLLSKLEKLNAQINKNEIDTNSLNEIYNLMNTFQTDIKRYQFSLLSKDDEIKQRIDTLERENREIEKGKKNYDPRLVSFKEQIEIGLRTHFKEDVKVHFLADLVEVKDESWRVAIETYLNTQRFYLIVEPKYVNYAIKIYNDIKSTLPYFDYGIVDTEKVILNAKAPLPKSLAEELVSNNEGAKAFVDMLLGALIKCDSINTLRHNPRSITRDGMLYQNYVARALNTRGTICYIGSNSATSTIAANNEEINNLRNELNLISIRVMSLGKLTRLDVINSNEIKTISHNVTLASELPVKHETANEYKQILDGLSDNFIVAIDKQIAEIEKTLNEIGTDKINLHNDITKAKVAIERSVNEDLVSIKQKIQSLKEKISSEYKRNWIMEVGEPSFLEVLKVNSNPLSLYNQYKLEIDYTLNNLNNKWKWIVELRTRYNTIYELNYESNNPSNEDYEKEYKELGEVKLNEYLIKIKEAKDNAMKEFRNDFLAKLKDSFDTAFAQINSLNEALKFAKFGNDSYSFSVEPKQEYKDYYNMINDPLLLTGTDIEAEEFTKKYSETIESLFRQITFTDSEDARSELEQNIKIYTDYTSYLKFDLNVINANGYKQRLSKTIGRKSGGETQTPFYISVLASFAQLYRLNSNVDLNNPIRLIVFDEAFSKMDPIRVEESIKLLRSFGLQAIISAPNDKAQIISPLVDRTICTVRDNTYATIRPFFEK